MIKVSHPFDTYNYHQRIIISHTIQEDKEYLSLYFSFKNASYLYYCMQSDIIIEIYQDWLNEIQDYKLKENMKQSGFEACKTVLAFKQYIIKLRKMDELSFICMKMGKDDYYKYNSFKTI